MLVDGIREVRRAIKGGIQLDEMYFCFDGLDENRRQELQAVYESVDCPCYQLPAAAFEKVGFGNRNEGVLAVGQAIPLSLEEFAIRLQLTDLPRDGQPAFILVLDGIEKPGNIGAVFRTAAAAGVDGILLTNEICDPFNPNVIRASLGTLFDVPFASCDIPAAKSFFVEHEISVHATRIDGAQDYARCDYRVPAALVLGSESDGVGKDWFDVPSVAIPMSPLVDSLNISATAAVFCFEVQRQRRIDAVDS